MDFQIFLINALTSVLFLLPEVGCFDQRQSTKDMDDVRSLIRRDGYPLEVHHVVTDDGYIIELHRIPHGKDEAAFDRRKRKDVVFLAHCIMCSSAAFVVLGPNGGLAYMLANDGYDVWMVNSRGSKYSRRHITISPDHENFWKFSWHEQGIYDIPASIDYVLEKTGESKLDIIGFSMGTTQMFVLLSERPEYNEKIKSLTALAPAAFVGNSKTAIARSSSLFGDFALDFFVSSGVLEVASKSSGLKELFSNLCIPNVFLRKFCIKALIMAGGKNNGNINDRSLPFFFKFFPESTSLRSIVHFLQLYRTGRFQKYNYGRKMNKLIYGSQYPAEYDLSRVTAPVNLLWSSGDDVTVPKDVKKLLKLLPNIASTHEIQEKDFSHVDFIWSRYAPKLVNKVVLRNLKDGEERR